MQTSTPNFGLAKANFEESRGFRPLGEGLPDNFLEGDRTQVLATLAFLFTHPDPMKSQIHCQAVSLLAAYALGAQVDLKMSEYRQLVERAVQYTDLLMGEGLMREARFACYVVRCAQLRAAECPLG